MITTPEEDNIKLTPENLKQIETAQIRLANLQNETVIATKLLNETKTYCVTATKEKTYQEELLGEITARTTSANTEYQELLTKIETARTILSEETAKSNVIGLENKRKQIELLEREESLLKAESDLKENLQLLTTNTEKLEKDKEEVEKAKEILLSAVQSIKL